MVQVIAMAKKKWIKKAIKNPGALTKQAKAEGKTVAEFIASPPKEASTKTKKRIVLAMSTVAKAK